MSAHAVSDIGIDAVSVGGHSGVCGVPKFGVPRVVDDCPFDAAVVHEDFLDAEICCVRGHSWTRFLSSLLFTAPGYLPRLSRRRVVQGGVSFNPRFGFCGLRVPLHVPPVGRIFGAFPGAVYSYKRGRVFGVDLNRMALVQRGC